tara:strand:- start:2109 stop:2282 length:174 start_codon:yes stop_codon:yes gene_type:complete
MAASTNFKSKDAASYDKVADTFDGMARGMLAEVTASAAQGKLTYSVGAAIISARKPR